MWSRCCSMPRRSPPNHSAEVVGARPSGQLVPRPRDGPARRLDVEAAGGEAVGEDLVHDRAEVPVGAAGVDRDEEVVRVRDVALDEPGAVRPGVAQLAAGEQEAVAHLRIAHGNRGSPPRVGLRLLVDLRPHADRIAVDDAAERDGIDGSASRDAQPDDRLVADLGRPLDEVEVGAVVVRLGEQRRSQAVAECQTSVWHRRRPPFRDRHPFTDPCVSPETMYRCRK